MRIKHISTRIFLAIIIMVFISIVSLASIFTSSLKSFYYEEKLEDLFSRAKFFSNQINQNNINDNQILNQLCIKIGKQTNTRITLIDLDGNVLGDSDENPDSMSKHTGEYRDEIKLAKENNKFGSSVRFSDTVKKNMMYLAYPVVYENQELIIRTSIPVTEIDNKVNGLYLRLFIFILIFSIVALLTSYFLSKRLTAPLKSVEKISYKYSKGDFSSRLDNYDVVEFNNLSKSLNKMAEELDKLEGIRKEFVSNVSHELKTPITSIKGYIEIMENSIDDKELNKYLKIMNKNSDRLNNIIDDLLILSRIEDSDLKKKLTFKIEPLAPVIDSVISDCASLIKNKDINILVNCSKEISISQNTVMMHQALSNLLNNSIKYSKDNSNIYIIVTESEKNIMIEVKDEGIGINSKHFDRLFERFYRVDESRSRDVGGTGLGLAIVKHIIKMHSGSIEVQSTENIGTTFTIKIPKF